MTENVDTTSGVGEAMFQMIAVFAQLEGKLASERTKLAMAHKREKGERTSRFPRFGYDLVPGSKVLAPNAGEHATLTSIREWRTAGLSFGKICKRLEAAGIRTKLGCVQWQPKTVARICGTASS